jgi:hypothetical protein
MKRPRATRAELTNVVTRLLKFANEMNERLNSLARSQLEMTVVLSALRKKGLLTDEDVQEAWEEFKSNLDPQTPEGDHVEPEGEDADLGSAERGEAGVLRAEGDGDAAAVAATEPSNPAAEGSD